MLPALRSDLNKQLYLRDPQATDLGRRELTASVQLLDKIGSDGFNFKKLTAILGSTEASVYRYFEHKHHLLSYLVRWYWAWLRFRVRVALHNVADPYQRPALAAVGEASAEGPAPLVRAVNPTYAHSHALVSTLVEAAHNQFFCAQHLPLLTDPGENVRGFIEHLPLAALPASMAVAAAHSEPPPHRWPDRLTITAL